ncbi:hypothetical protein DF147_20160 [Burkholderia cenocepacia]|nr:hypothetical protein DF147_20160 [Burkholderia cenocepacia]RQV66976.1 hypothetical protein DF024_08035 [Burkholderia cenocepacia]RQV90463.1 hypothetical protein DF019_07830 [Burkholderia cenocepacia]
MPCTPFRLPGGTSGIFCTRGRKRERRCSVDRRGARAAAHVERAHVRQHRRPGVHAQRMEHELVAPDGIL